MTISGTYHVTTMCVQFENEIFKKTKHAHTSKRQISGIQSFRAGPIKSRNIFDIYTITVTTILLTIITMVIIDLISTVQNESALTHCVFIDTVCIIQTEPLNEENNFMIRVILFPCRSLSLSLGHSRHKWVYLYTTNTIRNRFVLNS